MPRVWRERGVEGAAQIRMLAATCCGRPEKNLASAPRVGTRHDVSARTDADLSPICTPISSETTTAAGVEAPMCAINLTTSAALVRLLPRLPETAFWQSHETRGCSFTRSGHALLMRFRLTGQGVDVIVSTTQSDATSAVWQIAVSCSGREHIVNSAAG
jgi:hypothetical protein